MKCYDYCRADSHISMQADALKGAFECHIRTRDFEQATENARTLVRIGRQRQMYNASHNLVDAVLVELIFEANVNLLLVLLIQKRKDEAQQVMSELETEIAKFSSLRTTAIVFLRNMLIPLLGDLTVRLCECVFFSH